MTAPAVAAPAPTKSSGARVAVQKFGTFLSGMIMPNIAAFIAWGLITAFFIEKGWTPVPGLGGFGVDAAGKENTGIVGPMIRYMLPLLIAGQGGRMVYSIRGKFGIESNVAPITCRRYEAVVGSNPTLSARNTSSFVAVRRIMSYSCRRAATGSIRDARLAGA